MVKLLRSVTHGMSALIPGDVKRGASDYFVRLTNDLDEEDFRALIDKDLSVWADILPSNIKVFLFEGARDRMTKIWGQMAPDSLIAQFIMEARPDLNNLFESPVTRDWLMRQIAEFRQELGV